MKTYGKKQIDNKPSGIALAFNKAPKSSIVPASMFTTEVIENIEDASSPEENSSILHYRSIQTKPSPLKTYNKSASSVTNLISESAALSTNTSISDSTHIATIDGNPIMATKVDKPNKSMFFKNATEYQLKNKEFLAKVRPSGEIFAQKAQSYWGEEDQENPARDFNKMTGVENNKPISTYFRIQNTEVARKLQFDDVENSDNRISYDWQLYKGGIKNLGNSCYMSSIVQVTNIYIYIYIYMVDY
jgi:hypothetical protein